MSTDANPDAQASIHVDAAPEQVYALVSDPGVLAELAGEYEGHRWLGGATEAAVGARFRGRNRNGFRRWSTTSTITDAAEGERFAFEVSVGPLRISRWQYDIEPDGDIEQDGAGCRVVERTWDRRPGWARVVTGTLIGISDRRGLNQRNMEKTLAALKRRAEAVATS
ncbi:Polyketide cyclase / dehydrase and lipid transport [Prauserella sp. Am3]|nr:Polyketide cyclase / dehydrase and lipid transport [Prauserella sp. Am3]